MKTKKFFSQENFPEGTPLSLSQSQFTHTIMIQIHIQVVALLFSLLLQCSVGGSSSSSSPLVFQYQQRNVHWDQLGPSVNTGNGLLVAFNGTHTRVSNLTAVLNRVDTVGFYAWELVETKGGPPARYDGYAMAPLSDGRVLMYGGSGDYGAGLPLNDTYIYTPSSSTSK